MVTPLSVATRWTSGRPTPSPTLSPPTAVFKMDPMLAQAVGAVANATAEVAVSIVRTYTVVVLVFVLTWPPVSLCRRQPLFLRTRFGR